MKPEDEPAASEELPHHRPSPTLEETPIYLEDEMYRFLDDLARSRGVRVDRLVHDLLQDDIERLKTVRT